MFCFVKKVLGFKRREQQQVVFFAPVTDWPCHLAAIANFVRFGGNYCTAQQVEEPDNIVGDIYKEKKLVQVINVVKMPPLPSNIVKLCSRPRRGEDGFFLFPFFFLPQVGGARRFFKGVVVKRKEGGT